MDKSFFRQEGGPETWLRGRGTAGLDHSQKILYILVMADSYKKGDDKGKDLEFD